jgi:hypothetical protein
MYRLNVLKIVIQITYRTLKMFHTKNQKNKNSFLNVIDVDKKDIYRKIV